jgi:hypothetical protein
VVLETRRGLLAEALVDAGLTAATVTGRRRLPRGDPQGHKKSFIIWLTARPAGSPCLAMGSGPKDAGEPRVPTRDDQLPRRVGWVVACP